MAKEKCIALLLKREDKSLLGIVDELFKKRNNQIKFEELDSLLKQKVNYDPFVILCSSNIENGIMETLKSNIRDAVRKGERIKGYAITKFYQMKDNIVYNE